MKKLSFMLLLCILGLSQTFAQSFKNLQIRAYIDKDGLEKVVTWDASSNKVKIYRFSNKQYNLFSAQLPDLPLGTKAKNLGVCPYVDNEGEELILVWDVTTGNSKIYEFLNGSYKALNERIPDMPLGKGFKNIQMEGYIDKKGEELIWVWDTRKNKAKLFYFNGTKKVYEGLEESIPADPLN